MHTIRDDSFEHEAWHRSGRERVVLVFEVHYSDLRAKERAAIGHAAEFSSRWLHEHRVPR